MRDPTSVARRGVAARRWPLLCSASLWVVALACSGDAGPVSAAGGRDHGDRDERNRSAAVLELPGAPETAERAASAPILGASVDAAGLNLELYALPAGGAGSPDGLVAGSLVASHRRRAAGVEVLLRRPVVAGDGAGAGGTTVAAGQPEAPPPVCRIAHDLHVVRLTLNEPLGPGPLIDAATDVALEPMVESHIRRPSSLPAGWRLLDEHPLREGDRQTGWTQRYGPSDAVATLSIVQRRASLGPTQRFQVDRDEVESLVVRGALATWSRQANWNAASLVWTEGEWELALSSSSPDGVSPALDRPTLLAFAADLAPGGSAGA